jgi:hypothetical protein
VATHGGHTGRTDGCPLVKMNYPVSLSRILSLYDLGVTTFMLGVEEKDRRRDTVDRSLGDIGDFARHIYPK